MSIRSLDALEGEFEYEVRADDPVGAAPVDGVPADPSITSSISSCASRSRPWRRRRAGFGAGAIPDGERVVGVEVGSSPGARLLSISASAVSGSIFHLIQPSAAGATDAVGRGSRLEHESLGAAVRASARRAVLQSARRAVGRRRSPDGRVPHISPAGDAAPRAVDRGDPRRPPRGVVGDEAGVAFEEGELGIGRALRLSRRCSSKKLFSPCSPQSRTSPSSTVSTGRSSPEQRERGGRSIHSPRDQSRRSKMHDELGADAVPLLLDDPVVDGAEGLDGPPGRGRGRRDRGVPDVRPDAPVPGAGDTGAVVRTGR